MVNVNVLSVTATDWCKMKLQWCILFVLSLTQVNGETTKLSKLYPYLREECANELNLNLTKVPQLYDSESVSENNEDYGKFYTCIWDKLQIIDKNGTINAAAFDKFVKDLSNGNYLQVIAQKSSAVREMLNCKYMQGETPEIIGIRIKNCIAKTRPMFLDAGLIGKPFCFGNHDPLTTYDPKGICLDEFSKNYVKPLEDSLNSYIVSGNDKLLGRFLTCSWKQLGIINEDGTINALLFQEFVKIPVWSCLSFINNAERENALSIITRKCADIQGDTEEATAVGLNRCMRSTILYAANVIFKQRILSTRSFSDYSNF